nr:hypothetical protein [Pandoravirus massiliensis]
MCAATFCLSPLLFFSPSHWPIPGPFVFVQTCWLCDNFFSRSFSFPLRTSRCRTRSFQSGARLGIGIGRSRRRSKSHTTPKDAWGATLDRRRHTNKGTQEKKPGNVSTQRRRPASPIDLAPDCNRFYGAKQAGARGRLPGCRQTVDLIKTSDMIQPRSGSTHMSHIFSFCLDHHVFSNQCDFPLAHE